MKPLKKFLWIILYTLDGIVLAGLILSSFSGFVSPQRFIIPAYLGLFFPFILVGNIAVFFVWLLFKQWKPVLLHLAVFAFCGSAIYTYCPLHLKTDKIPEDAIKILTYNVMRFNNLKKDTLINPPSKILKYIQENNADIVCIQEFGASKNNSSFLSEQDISGALKNYPYYYAYPLQFPHPNEDYGIAIFSRFPILSFQKVPFGGNTYNGSFVAELDVRGKRVTLINNHLESTSLSPKERNDYYQFTKEMHTKSIDYLTQTMNKRLTPAFKARAGQAQIISNIIKENKNPYIIVCGDFNDTPISYARQKVKGNLRDTFVDSGFGLGITYNEYRFLFRIDYILHSNNIKSYNCTVGNLKSSDHYPLSCYLQLQ
ncbi:MAG: endonuclease/exonuclease/phosphatase family protein [Paludibacter sp.]|nr:endonuclease/exonuclease/phosphatase family protein [Paludibacter sp.]